MTYDADASELFARKAVEVCEALSLKKTFAYIEKQEGCIWYLLMCNMPFFEHRLEWGTSIRGAWWGEPVSLCSCGLWTDGGEQIQELKFSPPEWGEFISAVVAFAAPEIRSAA